MESEKTKFDGSALIVLALFLLSINQGFTTVFERFTLSVVIYYLLYEGILIVFNIYLSKSLIVLFIYTNIIGLPIKILKISINSWYYFMQISLFLFITFGLLPSLIMSIFPEKYSLGALYIGMLGSIVAFSYGRHRLWKYVKGFYGNKSENKLIIKTNNIALVYISMISVYIFFNFVDLSKIDISIFMKPSTFSILKEVLVTFIAIDGFRQLISKRNNQ